MRFEYRQICPEGWFKQYLLISMIHIVNGIIQRYIGSDSKR